MNDPWEVKSRQAGQYVSCMKLNGVPLLPPLLSKECRKEMQYYRLLAREVEKRIAELKAYVGDTDEDSTQDNTDAPDLPQEYEPQCERGEKVLLALNHSISTFREDKLQDSLSNCTNITSPDVSNSISWNSNASQSLPKFTADIINNGIRKSKDTSPQHTPQPSDPPERDCNTTPKKHTPNTIEKDIDTDEDTFYNKKPAEREIVDLLCVEFNITEEPHLSDPFPDMSLVDGPSSLSSKSFTGSLNNIHKESVKDASTLVRQSSYTVLNPSPLLLAHLKVQSMNTGVEVTSISMSESLSNLTTPKKRRSWDLESAKIKWSSMAHELKQKTLSHSKADINKNLPKQPVKKSPPNTQPGSKSVQEKPRRASLPGKTFPKTEPVQKLNKCTPSPYSNRNSKFVKEANKPTNNQPSPKKLISECEDPASKVKELYDKIQNQQLLQMASLVEKQKREQMLLQQVFDEQNSILCRQLKTICPKSPVEAKAAWADKVDRGPVSLSQLINHKSEQNSITSTLTDTHNNLEKCAAVLKKSKDITGSIKKTSRSGSPGSPVDGSRTRTHSPKRRTSRKLSYDTSSSEFDPILTDRTNDTMVGLNVTFTSDSDEPTFFHKQLSRDSTMRNEALVHSIKAVPARRAVPTRMAPTPEQLAAATTIVAHAKGYLVRRLLRTERVQATVQTIRDALLCALQMHQDRAGIRGADVDLHRRLIQQITAACYSLHDTFVASTPAARCALIAADRERRRQRPPPARHFRQNTDIMSRSHSGAFPARAPRATQSLMMTQSHYETFSSPKLSSHHLPSPHRRPWR